MNRILIAITSLALWTFATFWAGWEWRDRSCDADQLRAELEFAAAANYALVETLDAERAKAAELADIAAKYEQEKTDAQAAADRTIADLRAGNVRLQNRWAGCPAVPQATPAAGQPDGAADDRIESAGRVVRAAAECDAQVRGLQALVMADRARP